MGKEEYIKSSVLKLMKDNPETTKDYATEIMNRIWELRTKWYNDDKK